MNVRVVDSVEQVRLTNSGTEAVMSAVRVARAFTRKNKIIKFSGSYHGHVDYLLDSLGVPKDFTKHTIVLPFNDIEAVKETAKKYQRDLAAIIVEPVAANCGVILPKADFLQGLRRVADKYNIVLILDEVITGFRVAQGGAQGLYNIKPDLTCLGKIIGGGLPIGAFGGKKEIMQYLSPLGPVYQAGTLSGNPLGVSAGLKTLQILSNQNIYKELKSKADKLTEGLLAVAKSAGIRVTLNRIESMFTLFFTGKNVVDYTSALNSDQELFARYFQGMLEEGIYLPPSQFEANFVSTAHTDEDIERTIVAAQKVFNKLRA